MRAYGHFYMNVLGEAQGEIRKQFAISGGNKFEGVGWSWSRSRLPVIDGCVAYLECALDQVHGAGDHETAVGRVIDLSLGETTRPLLFFRGSYRQLLHLDSD